MPSPKEHAYGVAGQPAIEQDIRFDELARNAAQAARRRGTWRRDPESVPARVPKEHAYGVAGRWPIEQAQAAAEAVDKHAPGGPVATTCPSGVPAKPTSIGCPAHTSRCVSDESAMPPDGGSRCWTFEGGAYSLHPLLRTTPPIPVSRFPGRFRVVVRRSCLSQPLGISITKARHSGEVVIAEDLSHLGLRRGDAVLKLNGHNIWDLNQAVHKLESCLEADLTVVHRERPSAAVASSSCASVSSTIPEAHDCVTVCMHPPTPRTRSKEWYMRDLVLSTGPVKIKDDIFGVRIERASRKIRFGLSFCGAPLVSAKGVSSELNLAMGLMSGKSTSIGSGEDVCQDVEQDSAVASRGSSRDSDEVSAFGHDFKETASLPCLPMSLDGNLEGGARLVLARDMSQHGLKRGDQLLQINGMRVHSSSFCQATMKNAMTLDLVFQRSVQAGPISPLTDAVPRLETETPASWVWTTFVSMVDMVSCMTVPSLYENYEVDAVTFGPEASPGPSRASGAALLMRMSSDASVPRQNTV